MQMAQFNIFQSAQSFRHVEDKQLGSHPGYLSAHLHAPPVNVFLFETPYGCVLVLYDLNIRVDVELIMR